MVDIANREHVFFDIDTLSKKQNAAIISIGAVKFSTDKGITSEFKVNITPKSNLILGLHIDKETVEWWNKQPKEISALWKVNPVDIGVALSMFEDFIGESKTNLVWSKSAWYNAIMRNAKYEYFNVWNTPDSYGGYKWYQEMDFNTIMTVMGVMKPKGDTSCPMKDAKIHAESFIELFKEIC